MVRQDKRHCCATSQSDPKITNDLFHFRAISTGKWEINTKERVEPKILIFQIDETSNILGGLLIDLCNAANNGRLEAIGVFWNSTHNLYNTGRVHFRRNGMLGNKKRLLHSMAFYHIIPTLAKIRLNICDRWPLNQRMCV